MSPYKKLSLLLLIVILIALFIWGIHRRGYFLPGSVSIAVDTKITPAVHTIPGFDKEPPRPVAALSDGKGTTISFVENELIYSSDDKAALEAFVKRWSGTVVRDLVPSDAGLRLPSAHLVRIDARSGDTKQMVSDMKKLNPGRSGNLMFSSDAGLALVAIASHEAAAGNPIGINFILSPTGYSDKNLTEGMPPATASFPKLDKEPFDRNPNNWSYFVRGPNTQNIGVGDAWRALDQVGRLKNKVKIAVIDGGFLPNDDNPNNFTINTNSIWAQDPNHKNDMECAKGFVCDWHGTNVVGTLMGVPGNIYGAAGPAGPVATNPIAIRGSGDVYNYMTAFVVAMVSNARIVNMSFGGGVPFLLSWAALTGDAYTILMHNTGQLLFAAAGNDGVDVDAEDCAWPFDWPCWERVWYVPCENGGVTCIGALTLNEAQKWDKSNYGNNDVDLFGPGLVWVGPDLEYPEVHAFSATSAASPFVAGVAALVLAANPTLTNDQVEKILIDTANPSSDGRVRRYVNAYDAVIKALGGTPPEITIAVDAAQQFGACETLYNFSATTSDPDNGPPTVKWTSNNTVLGTGNSFSRTLPPGTYNIIATATDGIGLSTQSNLVPITAGGPPLAKRPTINIISLVNHQKFAANQDITLEAGGLDPDKALGGLIASNVQWSDLNAGPLGTGQRLIRRLSVGSHFIIVNYTGICGATVDDQRLIEVTPALADAPPNMYITKPTGNDLVIRVDPGSGEACLQVDGYGWDVEDKDYASIDFWETNRSDLQIKALSFDQTATVCLKAVPGAASTEHLIRLRGRDKKGHLGFSSTVLKVTVLPAVH